jgi:uncharacterized protein (DUF2141 family)
MKESAMLLSVIRLGLLGIVLVGARSAAADPIYNLKVRVSGATPGKGQILASLFNSSATHMKTAANQIVEPVREAQSVVLDFGSHRSGEYSVAVIYDENGNGELDTGLLGIPKERVAFSNNAKGRFGPAKWETARFLLKDSDLSLEITLIPVAGDG